MTTDGPADLNRALWGPLPDAASLTEIANRDLLSDAYDRAAALCLTRLEVRDLRGTSEATVCDWIDAAMIVPLDSDQTLFPAWQFDGSGAPHPGIGQLMETFGSVVALTEWMTAVNVEFGGRTPARALVTEPDKVVYFASILTATSW